MKRLIPALFSVLAAAPVAVQAADAPLAHPDSDTVGVLALNAPPADATGAELDLELDSLSVPVIEVPSEVRLAGLRQTLEAFEHAERDAAESGFYDWDLDGDGRRSYREWWLGELHRLGDLDLYGVSAQLPQG